MLTLAIETSCDETAIALVDSKNSLEHKILINLVASQIKAHQRFGGVVPSLAAREHTKNLPILLKKILKEYPYIPKKIDSIAYTDKPGLEIALIIGRHATKTLSYKWGIPAYPVNHLHGHLFASFVNINFPILAHNYEQTLEKIFPAIGLVLSGGHTQLYLIKNFKTLILLGETLDDAVGEAFDKVAKMMGLQYPGGALIEKLAKKGKMGKFNFPSPMIYKDNYNFSYSGLKTSVLYTLKKLPKLSKQTKADISLAFQNAAFKVIEQKTEKALKEFSAKTLIIGGGVSVNNNLRERADKLTKKLGINLLIPLKNLCTDNAAMIGIAHNIMAHEFKMK